MFVRGCLSALCLLTSMSIAPVIGAEPLLVDDATGELSLGMHLKYFEDPRGALTVDDVLKPEVSARFVKSQVATPNFGYTESVYWFSLALQNNSPQVTHRLLEID